MNRFPIAYAIRRFHLVRLLLLVTGTGVGAPLFAQGVTCDPNQVVTAERCANCHVAAVSQWKQTPHFQTFYDLSRDPRAAEICNNLGLRSVKRSNVCTACHFTSQMADGRIKAVSGISCESCHGAAREWLTVHSDYGGPQATRVSESPEHATQRLESSLKLGMKNTRDLYAIASSCFACHTVPNEDLVNRGGHQAGSATFELVRWSQGSIRHNFLRSAPDQNAITPIPRLRVMLVVGLIADLEYSTRATAAATSKSTYGLTVARRSADVAVRLYQVQQQVQDPTIQTILEAFATAELKANNSQQLLQVADQIGELGHQFAQTHDGSKLTGVDSLLPSTSEYR